MASCDVNAKPRKSTEILLDRPQAKSAAIENAKKTFGRAKSAVSVTLLLQNRKGRDPPNPTGLLKPEKPQRPKLIKSATLRKSDLERLHNAAKVISFDEKIEALRKREETVKQIEEEAEREKLKFKQIDEARLKARGEVHKQDLFAEEKVKILEQSFIARHEQEEEVKRVNRIMLNAKCHAIRDAQVQEKIELARELKQEEARLEKMMRDRALKSLKDEDENIKREQEKKQKYADEIKTQLRERENERFLEAERAEEEAKVLHLANEALKKEEEKQAQLARERRLQLREELNRVSEMSNYFKKMLWEQEQEAEMRILAYKKSKEKREGILDIERKIEKQAFERKKQLLFDLQQKILESKTTREEMALTRQQENIEREYRRKEKEAAIRKKELEKSLHEARLAQLQDAKLREALQIARNEDKFQKLVETLKKEEARQAKLQEERLKNRDRYRNDIVKQMNEKENERRRMQEREHNEFMEWREQEKQRERNVKAVIQSKLQTMRDANLPEKYIKDVERQMMKISELPKKTDVNLMF